MRSYCSQQTRKTQSRREMTFTIEILGATERDFPLQKCSSSECDGGKRKTESEPFRCCESFERVCDGILGEEDSGTSETVEVVKLP